VDIIAKRAVEYVPPNENSDTRLSAVTTGKRTVRSPRLGADAAWTWIRDWARWGLPHDDRQIQGAIRLAHFRAAKDFTPGGGNRAPAQRPQRHSQFGLGSRQVTGGSDHGTCRRHRIDGPSDAARRLRRRQGRARSACCQGLRRHGRGTAASRNTAAGRSLYLASPPALGAAAPRGAADGQYQLHVLPGDHAAPAGREDGAVLAPCVRDRQLEGRQLRSDTGADRSVPQPRHGQLSRPAAEGGEESLDDLLAGQQPEP